MLKATLILCSNKKSELITYLRGKKIQNATDSDPSKIAKKILCTVLTKWLLNSKILLSEEL